MLHPNSPADDPLGDPRNFLWLLWSRLGLPDPTPIQYEVAEYLAFGPDPTVPRWERPNNYLMAQGFRGLGKSWLASGLDLWELYWDPSANTLVTSATAQRAGDFSRFCHRLLHEVPELAHLRPGPNQRDSAIAWDVGPAPAAHAPSCRSLGIQGQLTGSRADLILPDDVEIPTNSATEEMRAKIRAAFAEFTSILKPRGRVAVLGTPQTVQTVYRDLVSRGYHLRRWPARVPTPDEVEAMGPETLAPSVLARVEAGESGQPTEPTRFPNRVLEEREAVIGRSVFRTQFQLDTSLSDAYRFPLRLADLVVTDLDHRKAPQTVVRGSSPVKDLSVCGLGTDRPRAAAEVDDWAPYDLKIVVVDPAGRGRDETVALTLGAVAGNVYLLGAWASRGAGYDDATLQAICRQGARYDADLFVVEANFGDSALVRLLEAQARAIHPRPVEEVTSRQQKEARIIDTLEPVMNQGRLIVARSVLEWDARPLLGDGFGEDVVRRLTYQLSRITREKGCLAFDDRVDALALGVRWLLDQLRLRPDEEVQRRDEAAQDAEIRRFLQLADGVDREAVGWGGDRRRPGRARPGRR